jgi:murein DD-endopeptidase MepM/ murein hydrolase activator NlpD
VQAKLCIADRSIQIQKHKQIDAKTQKLVAAIVKDKVSFTWPVEVCRCWLSSLYGWRKSGYHYGVDLAALKGTPVYAVADAKVEIVQKSSDIFGYGNMILLNHELYQYKSRYAHLDTICVVQGDMVKQGQLIGTVGSTGHVIAQKSSDPSHLHFEIYRKNIRINPLLVLFAADKHWVKEHLS